MLGRKKFEIIALPLILVLLLSSCTNTNMKWHSGYLVAQLYRQYKQELLLAYNNFTSEMIVDEQHGYERAYFDNYRKEIIFIKEGRLDYLIDGEKLSTESPGITGYVEQVVISKDYQIGIEILDIHVNDLENGNFHGSKTRIINLKTNDNVSVDGQMFSHALIAGNYLYGLIFDNAENEFLDIINLQTMEPTRIRTDENDITFLYQIGDKVYAQVASRKTAFLIDGTKMTEQQEMYNDKLPVLGSAMEYIDDISPRESKNHWYVEPNEIDTLIEHVRLLNIHADGKIDETLINFNRDDILQIIDTANYGSNHIAIFYEIKDSEIGDWYTIIGVYDLEGNEVSSIDIEKIRNDNGRFTYLDYVE